MFKVIWYYWRLISHKYLEIFFDFKHCLEDIEEDSDDQEYKSEKGDPDTEDIHKNVRDMTASDITILKMSEEKNQNSKFSTHSSKFFYFQQLINLLN